MHQNHINNLKHREICQMKLLTFDKKDLSTKTYHPPNFKGLKSRRMIQLKSASNSLMKFVQTSQPPVFSL